jgi:hypothetical protein
MPGDRLWNSASEGFRRHDAGGKVDWNFDRKRGLALSRASLAVLGRAPATVQLIHTMEFSPIQRRQPHAATSTGNRAPVMKETASDMV